MTAIENRLINIERMLRKLLEAQTPEWISEKEACMLMGSGREWLKRERLGVGDMLPTLYKDVDWRYINGRTPEYKLKSIEFRKTYTSNRKIAKTIQGLS